jgi:CubicO group peptidase (beta-lactamase class C family)
MLRRCQRIAACAILLASLAMASGQQPPPSASPGSYDFSKTFVTALPEQCGIDSSKLIDLTSWLRDSSLPVFSLAISREGRLVYELYTSGIERDHAHYVMSVTKTVVSALIGIAIDARLLPGVETPITKVLPRHLFAGDQDFDRASSLTLRRVMGMSALDAPMAPHDRSPAGEQRLRAFWSADNRVTFALSQQVLPAKPEGFQYNDVTPALAVGCIQHASGMTAFEFAQQHLFGPLGFRNAEWMHQDAAGIDMGGYGLRLRPIDMQKLGVLYLRHGSWEGRQLIPKAWVDLSFTPWNRSRPEFGQPDYGWFWWTRRDGKRIRHEANGWKGQRIAVFPSVGLVVTMTACIEDGSEEQVFGRILDDYVLPAIRNDDGAALPPARSTQARLAELLHEARTWQRLPPSVEPRMVPSPAAKESRRPFDPKR